MTDIDPTQARPSRTLGSVRGYWLAQTVEYVRHHFEPAQRERLQQAFSGSLRRTLSSGNLGAWAPRQHQVELLQAVAGTAASDADARARLAECGAFVEKHVSNKISSLLFGIMTPDMFLRRLHAFWQRDHGHEHGRCSVELAPGAQRAHVELSEISGYDFIGPVWMGWTRSALASLTHGVVDSSCESWSRSAASADVFQFEVAWQ